MGKQFVSIEMLHEMLSTSSKLCHDLTYSDLNPRDHQNFSPLFRFNSYEGDTNAPSNKSIRMIRRKEMRVLFILCLSIIEPVFASDTKYPWLRLSPTLTLPQLRQGHHLQIKALKRKYRCILMDSRGDG